MSEQSERPWALQREKKAGILGIYDSISQKVLWAVAARAPGTHHDSDVVSIRDAVAVEVGLLGEPRFDSILTDAGS